MKKSKSYPVYEEDSSTQMVSEPVAAVAIAEAMIVPNDIPSAHIVNGTLQVTSDIEEEIAEVDRGETVSLGEFKTMFAKWLD